MLTPLQFDPTLIDQVHEQVVLALSTGRLPAGQRLPRESIADLLGVSRQPVSHALPLLKHQELLVEQGRRGLAITPIDAEKIRQLYLMREALDGLAARLAAQKDMGRRTDSQAHGIQGE